MQTVCDGGVIKHGSDYTCVCDEGHMVDLYELFAMRQNNRNGNQIKVCAIYGIQFTPMIRLR